MTRVGLILQGLGVVFAILGVLIQSYVENPEEHAEKIKSIQESKWNSVSNELGELFMDIQKEYPPSQYNEKEISISAKYALFIQESYNRGDLDDLSHTIEEFDKPRQLYESLKQHHDGMFSSLSKSIFFGVLSGAALVIENGELMFVSVALSTLFGIFLINAILEFRKYKNTREEMVSQWEEDFLY